MSTSARVLSALTAALMLELSGWAIARYTPATAALLSTVAVLPWLVLWPRLRRGDRRATLWAVLLTAPYLAYGLMEILANPGARTLASLQVLLTFAVFVAAIAHLRLSRPYR